MDLSSIKDAYISSTPVQSIWLNQIKIWSRDPYNIPPAIKSAMVLWYDIAKQGATNESMASNPILKDLSGNGHDATCYNFAWGGMSGIGGYVFNSDNIYVQPIYEDLVSVNKNIITYTKPIYSKGLILSNDYVDATTEKMTVNRPAFKIKVSGLNENEYLYIVSSSYDGLNWEINIINNKVLNGITDIPAIVETFEQAGTDNNKLQYQDFIVQVRTTGDSTNPSESIITIEILPQYPNALVSDGVDDYAYVEGLPILTDYTVIAKRTIINLNKNASMFASKSTYSLGNDGAFQFEGSNGTGVTKLVSSFGNVNTLKEYNADVVSYMTPLSYNGKVLSKGENIDTDKLILFRFCAETNALYGEVAMNSLILFNRTLTLEEIEWVKANLINGYPTPNVYYDCSLYTNETIDSTNPV